jgi:hypothetical protein
MLPSILHGCHFNTISSFSPKNFVPDIFDQTLYLCIYNISRSLIPTVSQTLTDLEIINAVPGHKLNESEDSDDSNGSVDEENKMTMAQAISHCDNLINFMEQKSFTTEQEIMQMYRLKEKFEKERRCKSKQTTLTDLFKRAVSSSNPSLSANSVTQKDFMVNKTAHIFLLLHDAFWPFFT